MNKRPLLSLAIAVVLLLTWFLFLRPTFLGGSTSYVMVSGSSMEPKLYTGDLVLLREQEHYSEGDLIAFHADGGAVIHRIIGGSEELGFVTQGDNEAFRDAWRPLPQQVIGRSWFRIPYAGTAVQHLQEPWLLALVLGGITSMSIFRGRQVAVHRARRSERHRASIFPPRLRSIALPSGAIGLSALLALVFLGIAVYGFTRPNVAEPSGSSASVTQRGEFEYVVRMAPSALYPSGTIRSQEIDPAASPMLYRNLLRSLDLRFAYEVTGSEPLRTQGHYSAVLVLEADLGWTKEVELLGRTPFDGESAAFDVPVDFREVFTLLEQIEEETEYRASSYTIKVVPTVEIVGQSGTRPLDSTFVPAFSMMLNGVQVSLGAERSHEEEVLLESPADAVSDEASAVGMTLLTWGAAGGSIASLGLGSMLAFVLVRRRSSAASCDAFRRRHASSIVEATACGAWNADRRMRVAEFRDLARIAEREGQLIAHEQLEERCLYRVTMANGVTAEFATA